MCMITCVPANVDLPVEGIYNGSVTNDDGHGYAIASAQHGLEVFKSMRYFDTWTSLQEARAKHGPNSIVLFHSRFGTHGEMSEYNVHPFMLTEDTVMAHNGIMPSTYHPGKGDRRSDTRIFADWVARDYCLNDNGVPSRRGAQTLSRMIGGGNKLAFLSVKSGQPKLRLVNAHLGNQSEGVWYSNSGYKWSYGGAYKRSDWRSDSWWGEEWDAHTRAWVPSRALEKRTSEGVEVCPMCTGQVDAAAMLCLDCDFCLDCEEYLDSCQCYLGSAPTSVIEIEDVADAGYVKVDGVWRMSTSLLDPKYDTTHA